MMNIAMNSFFSYARKNIRQVFLNALLLVLTFTVFQVKADVVPLPDLDPKFYSIQETNPTRDAGYVVGDTLDRTLVISIKKPYELIKESLPIVGYEHRWKGQISGIELVKIEANEKSKNDTVTHTLQLRYQVFTTAKTVKHGSLQSEILRIRNTKTKEVVQLRVPFFDFRISPLSLFGQIKLNEDMSPFLPPLTLDPSPEKRNVKLLIGLLVAALLGLLYMFGAYTWLPKMGGPFAKAYRDIRKLPDTADGLQQAVARVHQSLNTTAGASLFGNNVADLIKNKPAFAPMQNKIEQFFGLSRQVFFEPSATTQLNESPKTWLLKFCRQLRDCERGLPVESNTK
ncbi:MAG TPA: hypothetical protein PL131_00205 [Methylotenera sp.]|nr:hypothetical protein [Methylotenera sp.]HPH04267.1 hypothetical protein [Methylotenera sp.]HPM99821.1 hypothetical protein [Methylotenera sp.]